MVVDEIQKAPDLLDEVHRLIEEKGIKFLLTGSSARKLKQGIRMLQEEQIWCLLNQGQFKLWSGAYNI